MKKKEIIPLTNNEGKSYEKQKVCYMCEKEFRTDKKYRKIRDHCHYTGRFRGAAHSICNLQYKIPGEIPVVFHNGSTYDYHFIIKQLAIEFKGNFDCLGENIEKYITFSAPIYKKNSNNETVIYKLKFIDSFRFMLALLSSLVDNLYEIYKKECNDKSCKSINELMEKFPNTYQFCKGDAKKFVLLLRKGLYLYEYMDSWEKFNETSLPDKESFYSELNKEGIVDEDYAHTQNVWKVFEIKNLGKYHDLYVQSDMLLLPNLFENFRDGCINKYNLDPAHFLSAPGLTWLACLKKTGVKLQL